MGYGPKRVKTGKVSRTHIHTRTKFPDGRTAFGKEEKARARNQWEEKKARERKQRHTEHMEEMHPKGFAQIRDSTGNVVRHSGAKPWKE